jgi:hypothetical protein
MQFTDLPQNTSGVLYQNDSPTPLLVTVQVAGSFSTGARARAQPVIFNSTANPADQAVVGALSTGSRTYLIAPGQGIQVNAPNGGQIGFDVLIAPAA